MSAWTPKESPHAFRALDAVFSLMGGNRDPGREYETPVGVEEAPAAEVQPPPKVETQGDLQAAYEWLLRERKRLEGYTNAQLAKIQNEHAAMIARHYTNEQVMILRSQELANKEDFLTRQTRGLQQQAQQLAEREKALAGQREQLCKAHEEFATLQQSCTGARRDAEVQQALLDTLRMETGAVLRDREKAHEDLGEMEKRFQEQREARASEQALYAARQAQLDQRFTALEKAEEAAQQRLAELDDLETRLREEIEERETQLAAERRAVEALTAQLRQRSKEEPARKNLHKPAVPAGRSVAGSPGK